MNSKDYINKLKDILDNKLEDMLTNGYWESLLISKYPPVIYRLSYKIEDDLTVYLQKMFKPPLNQKAYMHSHSWDFAIKVLEGGYEMGIGYSINRDEIPEATFVNFIKPGDIYSMTSESIFHYTKPITNDTSYSVMIVGPRKRKRKANNNFVLPDNIKEELLKEFSKIITN